MIIMALRIMTSRDITVVKILAKFIYGCFTYIIIIMINASHTRHPYKIFQIEYVSLVLLEPYIFI